MALIDLVAKTKAILYGNQGTGETPSIILANANSNETINANGTIDFTIATVYDGDVSAGDVLSIVNATSEADAFMLYVIDAASSPVLTCLNGFNGSPSVTANALDDKILEIAPLRSEFFILQAIETVFSSLLWPDIYLYTTASVATPDLQYYQNEVPATVEAIEGAWQTISGEQVPIGFGLAKNVPTAQSSTNTLAWLAAIDGSAVSYTAHVRYLSSSTLPASVEQAVATGAAAISLGASWSETALSRASNDNEVRGQRNPATDLWRDFVTMRQGLVEDIAREVEWFEVRR